MASSHAHNIPPVIKMKTSDSTGYVIETINHTTMGPGGCVKVTTREIWKLTATSFSSGDIIAEVEPQQFPGAQNTKNEWLTGFGGCRRQGDTQGCSVCMSPRVLNITTTNTKVNWFEELSKCESHNKETREIVMEDASCETTSPKTVDAESQTDLAKKIANEENRSKIATDENPPECTTQPSGQVSADAAEKISCHDVSTQAGTTGKENKSVCTLPSKQLRNCMSQTDLTGSQFNSKDCQYRTPQTEEDNHNSNAKNNPNKNGDETKGENQSEDDSKQNRKQKKNVSKKDSDNNKKSKKGSKRSSKRKPKECNSNGNEPKETSGSSSDSSLQ